MCSEGKGINNRRVVHATKGTCKVTLYPSRKLSRTPSSLSTVGSASGPTFFAMGAPTGTSKGSVIFMSIHVISGGKGPYPSTSGRLAFGIGKTKIFGKIYGNSTASLRPFARSAVGTFRNRLIITVRAAGRPKSVRLVMGNGKLGSRGLGVAAIR